MEKQKRFLRVMKMRGSRHDHRLHELIIDPPRLAIGAPLLRAGMLGVTTRMEAAEEPRPALAPEPEALR